MNKQQFEHYIKGGKFKAIYKPTKLDISSKSKMYINTEIIVYQNILVTPIQDDDYFGQHCFNSADIHGWFPEEDIEIIEIIDDYIYNVEGLPKYMYRLLYTTQNQLEASFGRGVLVKPPFMAARTFNTEMDSYVMGLSSIQATKIEKAVWLGKYEEKINWEVLYEESEKPEDKAEEFTKEIVGNVKKVMTEEMKQQLRASGKGELVDIHEANLAGYAGMMPGTGMLVDRRKHPEAIPVPANELMGIPEPKEVDPKDIIIDSDDIFEFPNKPKNKDEKT